MIFARILALATAFSATVVHAGEAFVATPWQAAQSSEARLIAPLPGTPAENGWLYGAIEFRLAPDAKTYWRTAGETGVPPTFAFDGSHGVSDAEVLFPAPVAFDDGVGGLAYGYIAAAIFPIRFKATSAGAYQLAVTADYGVCLKTMCVPAQVKFAAEPAGVGEAGLAAKVEAARKRVPIKTKLNDSGPLSVTGVEAKAERDGLTITIITRSPAGEMPRVFVEGVEVFTASGSEPQGEVTRHRFRALRPGDTKPWGDAVITVAAGERAIETTVSLDPILKR